MSTQDGVPISQSFNSIALTAEAKKELRGQLTSEARKLLGIPYDFGAEWTDYNKKPDALDCSEMIEGIFKICGLQMPDGSQNQFNFTMATNNPMPGDLGFFGKSKDMNKIYHVGLVFDEFNIIEARGFQPESSFETGKVIIRPMAAWENYVNFVGYRAHAKLV